MSDERSAPRLSPEVFRELKDITHAELEGPMSDDEIEEMGLRVIKLYSFLRIETSKEVSPGSQLTDQESKALSFIKDQMAQFGRMPSVHKIARALGLSSSRSGFQILKRLSRLGLVRRDE